MEGNKIERGVVWTCEPFAQLSGNHVYRSEPELCYEHTLLINSEFSLDPQKISRGFRYLEQGWDIVAPLSGSAYCLRDMLSERMREVASEYLPDLRIVFYDMSFLWFGPNSKRTFDLWKELDENIKHRLLSFAVAVYLTCPYIMVVPTRWVSAGIPDFSAKGKKVYIRNISDNDIERAGKVFRAGHRKRVYLPTSLEAEIKSCRYLIMERGK
jgi:hypothetical protein